MRADWSQPGRSGLALLRQAVREGWPVEPARVAEIIGGVVALVESADARTVIAVGLLVLTAEQVNQAARPQPG